MGNRCVLMCSLSILICGAAWAKDAPAPAPYVWPALPDAAVMQRATATKTLSGLVLLDKRCELDIESWLTYKPGVRRDEFIRILIVSEEGAHRATLDINDDKDAKIESIEARTVAPDGRITLADPKNDIHKTEVGTLNNKDIFSSVATVTFPAPAKGCVLDLHVVTYRPDFVWFLMEPVGFEETPSLATSFTIRINGGLPRFQWSVLVAGKDGAKSHVQNKGGNTIEVTVDPFLPNKREPMTVPYYQRQTTLLCYLNTSYEKTPRKSDGSSYQTTYDVDPRGLYRSFVWQDNEFTRWWLEFFKEFERGCKEFIDKEGTASKVDVKAVAPENLALEARVERLYRFVQETVKYNPDAEDVSTLSALMKRGQNNSWQGTLFLDYLLKRAGIPHELCYLTSRYYLQFSPIVTGPSLYGFQAAVTLEVPGKGRIFLTPGDLGIPYGCLQDVYQDSLALWMEGEATMRAAYTPVDAPGADALSYRFEAELTPAGSLKGTLRLEETGAPAASFRHWLRYREFRVAHPDRKDKTSEQERVKAADARLREECQIPGFKLLREDLTTAPLPASSSDPVVVTCAIQAPGMTERIQDKWLLHVNPVLAGFVSPFTDEDRTTPIWYNEGGVVTITGTVKLPKGAKILELPRAEMVAGPDHTKIEFRTEATEVGGMPAVALHLVYDQPSIVGSDRYKAWQAYQAALARLAESRCVISLPATIEGTLE